MRTIEVLNKELDLLKDKLSDDLIGLLKLTRGYIAGGAITSILSGAKINDIDLYFRTKEDMNYSFSVLKVRSKGKPYVTTNAISMRVLDTDIQLIVKEGYYGSPEDVIPQFDFTVNMVAFVS